VPIDSGLSASVVVVTAGTAGRPVVVVVAAFDLITDVEVVEEVVEVTEIEVVELQGFLTSVVVVVVGFSLHGVDAWAVAGKRTRAAVRTAVARAFLGVIGSAFHLLDRVARSYSARASRGLGLQSIRIENWRIGWCRVGALAFKGVAEAITVQTFHVAAARQSLRFFGFSQ